VVRHLLCEPLQERGGCGEGGYTPFLAPSHTVSSHPHTHHSPQAQAQLAAAGTSQQQQQPAAPPAAAAAAVAAGSIVHFLGGSSGSAAHSRASAGALEYEARLKAGLDAAEASTRALISQPEMKAARRSVEKKITMWVSQISGTQQQVREKALQLIEVSGG